MKINIILIAMAQFLQITGQTSIDVNAEVKIIWQKEFTVAKIEELSKIESFYNGAIEELEDLKSWYDENKSKTGAELQEHFAKSLNEIYGTDELQQLQNLKTARETLKEASYQITKINKENISEINTAIDKLFKVIQVLKEEEFKFHEFQMQKVIITVKPNKIEEAQKNVVVSYGKKNKIAETEVVISRAYVDNAVESRCSLKTIRDEIPPNLPKLPNLQIYNDDVESEQSVSDSMNKSTMLSSILAREHGTFIYAPYRNIKSLIKIKNRISGKILDSLESKFKFSGNIVLNHGKESKISNWIASDYKIDSCEIIADSRGEASLLLKIKAQKKIRV